MVGEGSWTSNSMASRLGSLATTSGSCKACSSVLSSLVTKVAAEVDNRRECWGKFQVQSWDVLALPAGRKRRVHDQFQRAAAAAKLRKTVAQKSTTELERHWVRRQTLETRQEQLLCR